VRRLGTEALAGLAVPGPSYERTAVVPGIVHLGVGGFHRSHQAVYVERLLEAGHLEWGICGVGTQPLDRRMRDVLQEQDGLYSLVVRHPDGHEDVRVVGAIVDHLFAPDDPEAVVERMAAPTTHVVSLTITEGGYSVDPTTGEFRPTEPSVLLDLEPGAVPSTALGLLTEGLARRRDRGLPPVTVVSCDNVPQNGVVCRTAVTGFAERRDPELGAWVREHVAFPSSMVDRITPVTTDADRAAVSGLVGAEDGWPVVCEPWLQWVLEDTWSGPRPPWEAAGVQLVDDVHPYELMKLRLLNAGHQALGYLGYLAGHRTTDEACRDGDLVAVVLDYMEREATPTLRPVPGVDLAAYRRTLVERFGNPAVGDTLARLCAESSDRIAAFLLPVVREQLAAGGPVERSALVVAAWARYAEGVDEQGEPIVVVDRLLERVRTAAAAARREPAAFLEVEEVFGDLRHQPRFVEAFTSALRLLQEQGVRAALRA
jgi:mannitol 2-dehydrogenase